MFKIIHPISNGAGITPRLSHSRDHALGQFIILTLRDTRRVKEKNLQRKTGVHESKIERIKMRIYELY